MIYRLSWQQKKYWNSQTVSFKVLLYPLKYYFKLPRWEKSLLHEQISLPFEVELWLNKQLPYLRVPTKPIQVLNVPQKVQRSLYSKMPKQKSKCRGFLRVRWNFSEWNFFHSLNIKKFIFYIFIERTQQTDRIE